MSKKLSKEELESDPLIENYNRAVSYYIDNKTRILSIAIAFVVLVGSFFGYQYFSSAQETQAQEILAIAESAYAQGDFESALYGDDFELTYGFDQIADEFPRTNAGNLANYYAAVSSFKLGDIDNALMYMENFNVPKGILGVGPLTFHAKLHLAKEDYTAAADKFLQAADWDENEVTTPSNIYEAAQAQYSAENYDRASELVNRVINEYPQSSKFAESQRLKGMLAAN
jgi:outer membrane protein assembly factor BamD (BamD/ComL family)